MKKTYTTLEQDYHVALNKIRASLGIVQKRANFRTLPYLLEDGSARKLKPSRVWIISGISGSGKTTVSEVLNGAGFKKLPNVTTRPRRLGEKDSEYVFVDANTFLDWRKKNMLFHPHRRNAVWHAILKKDIQKLQNERRRVYLDKSIASSLALLNAFSRPISITFIYLLAPSFRDLYKRISAREIVRARRGEKALSKGEIFSRFKEEIRDMKNGTKLPYAYLVNDAPERIKKIIKNFIKTA